MGTEFWLQGFSRCGSDWSTELHPTDCYKDEMRPKCVKHVAQCLWHTGVSSVRIIIINTKKWSMVKSWRKPSGSLSCVVFLRAMGIHDLLQMYLCAPLGELAEKGKNVKWGSHSHGESGLGWVPGPSLWSRRAPTSRGPGSRPGQEAMYLSMALVSMSSSPELKLPQAVVIMGLSVPAGLSVYFCF